MEEGSFRCDANVSVRPEGTAILGTKTELKNLNSFKAVAKALEYEIRRQIDTLAAGETLIQETRLWDPDREMTRSMRNKESAHDYRYFPDPDLLPILVKNDWIDEIRRSIPELSEARRVRFIEQYKLPVYDAELVTSRRDIADYFESALKSHQNSKALSNWIVGDLFRALKDRHLDEQLYITLWPIPPEALAELVRLIDEGKISGRTAKTIFSELLDSGRFPNEVVAAKGLEQLSDSASLERAITQVLTDHPKQVAEYRSGNEKVFGFLVGQVMKATQGKANPHKANQILKRKLTGEV
jgi:aspartyl-tRNA(Asn)/glutamyl-tRNA(Gln) amidotransferase subunit B